jgi:hypothetical protein
LAHPGNLNESTSVERSLDERLEIFGERRSMKAAGQTGR